MRVEAYYWESINMPEEAFIELDDQKHEGLDIPAPKEIPEPSPGRVIELKIVDSLEIPDK